MPQIVTETAHVAVTHFYRRPNRRHFSIERLFADVRNALPPYIECRSAVSRFESRGVLKRLYNVFEASRRRSSVNHVTGDIHYVTLALPRATTVLTIHDCISLTTSRGLRKTVLRKVWFEWPARHAAVIITVSESSKREILKYTSCRAEKIKVIHNCVSPSFVPSPKAFNAECPIVLQLGTAPNKNIERLAAGLAGIRCHLHIVGVPTVAQRVALDSANVQYTVLPRLTDEEVLEAYRRADIVALVSTYEGFGLPIVEANAVGRPVVAGNVYSMPEVAADAACLVDPYNVAAIHRGFRRVIEDSTYRNGLIHAGFANACRFDSRTVAHQYASVYTSLLLPDRGPSARPAEYSAVIV